MKQQWVYKTIFLQGDGRYVIGNLTVTLPICMLHSVMCVPNPDVFRMPVSPLHLTFYEESDWTHNV